MFLRASIDYDARGFSIKDTCFFTRIPFVACDYGQDYAIILAYQEKNLYVPKILAISFQKISSFPIETFNKLIEHCKKPHRLGLPKNKAVLQYELPVRQRLIHNI